MESNNAEVVREVFCPLVDEMIEAIECIVNRDVIDGFLKMSCLPQKYKEEKDFIDVCKNCKWHNYWFE